MDMGFLSTHRGMIACSMPWAGNRFVTATDFVVLPQVSALMSFGKGTDFATQT